MIFKILRIFIHSLKTISFYWDVCTSSSVVVVVAYGGAVDYIAAAAALLGIRPLKNIKLFHLIGGEMNLLWQFIISTTIWIVHSIRNRGRWTGTINCHCLRSRLLQALISGRPQLIIVLSIFILKWILLQKYIIFELLNFIKPILWRKLNLIRINRAIIVILGWLINLIILPHSERIKKIPVNSPQYLLSLIFAINKSRRMNPTTTSLSHSTSSSSSPKNQIISGLCDVAFVQLINPLNLLFKIKPFPYQHVSFHHNHQFFIILLSTTLQIRNLPLLIP